MSAARFKRWLESDTNIKKAENIEPLQGMILVEIFMWRESGLIIDETTEALGGNGKGKVGYMPIAKVLKFVGDKFKAGDIVKLSYESTKRPVSRKQEYDAIVAHNNMYPDDYVDPGELYEGGIVETQKRYGFRFNPFDDSELIDNAKVVIPVHYLEVKQDPALMV
jgi:hypothetical protein